MKWRYLTVEVIPHKYDPIWQYLIFKYKDGKRAILFEKGDDKVTDTRAGVGAFRGIYGRLLVAESLNRLVVRSRPHTLTTV